MKDVLDRLQFGLLSACIVSLIVAIASENKVTFGVFVLFYISLIVVVAIKHSQR